MSAATPRVTERPSATLRRRPDIVDRLSDADPSAAARVRYSTAVGYLRACLVLLVVAHHAVLAYHPFAPATAAPLRQQPQWWQVFPIVDSERWTGFAVLVAFNDTFFMSLLFLISGLFVWSSLQRKGAAAFARERGRRLGVLFLLGAGLLAPLAYYPAYLQSTAAPGLVDFWTEWLSVGTWPAGPVWFIWVLLAFDVAAAVLWLWIPAWGDALGRGASRLGGHPLVWFTLLVAASAAVYVPAARTVGPLHWTTFGPFAFQTSRLLHYAVYFAAGVALGASDTWRGLLAPDGGLARSWVRWTAAAFVGFAVSAAVTMASMTQPDQALVWAPILALGFTLSCAASSFAVLAIFLRWARQRNRLFDSLRDCSYGIYLLHYAAVTWLQLALLGAIWPAPVKGSVVFVGAAATCWITVAVMRRLPMRTAPVLARRAAPARQ
jgi:peptidoglycan/LPS O-acetylase OafA/YrhL